MIGNEPTSALSSARSLYNTACAKKLYVLCVVLKINYFGIYLNYVHSLQSQIPQMRSMTDIASELCRSSSSLQTSATSGGSDGISRSNSCHSLSVSLSTYSSRLVCEYDEFVVFFLRDLIMLYC